MSRNHIYIALAGLTLGIAGASAIAQPINDQCSSALPIGLGAVSGTTIGATGSGISASCSINTTTPDVYYVFTAPSTCEYEILTCDGETNYDSAIAVYSACPTSSNLIACNDDGCGSEVTSRVVIQANRFSNYVIRVGGFGPASGRFTLIVRQLGRPANDTCITALVLSGASGSVLGDTTCAMAEGTQNCITNTTDAPSMYFNWIAPDHGVVVFDTCDFANFDSYISVSTGCPHNELTTLGCNDDSCGVRAALAFSVVRGASYIVRVSGFDGNRGAFTLKWNFSPVAAFVSNDTCDTALPISLGTIVGNTAGGTFNDAISCSPFTAPDIYYGFQSPVETFVTLSTCVPQVPYDTIVSVHSACPPTDANQIACNDNACGVGSTLNFSAKPGVRYIVRVSGHGTVGGPFTLSATAAVDAVVFDPSTLGEYYLLRDNRTFNAFRNQANRLGAALTTINNFNENQFVTRSVMQAGKVVRSAAIGLTDEQNEGILSWDSGSPLGFTYFLQGQPDNFGGGEDFIHIIDTVGGVWNDYPGTAFPGVFAIAEADRRIRRRVIDPNSGHMYLLFEASSWQGAQARARAMGGNLVTINGPAENEFVRTQVAANVSSRGTWIGLFEESVEGSYRWADGSNSTFSNFAPGEPNNAGGDEDYTEMLFSTGQWNDATNIEIDRPRHGIAEIILPTVIGSPVRRPGGCGTYVLFSASTFYPAMFAAERIGGHIVTIDSPEENEFIRSTFANAGGGRRIWLNATDRDDEGTFNWLDGSPFTYTNFANGEPNNAGGNEDYLVMSSPITGRWSDVTSFDSVPTFAVVEISCQCDWNADGFLNSQDFFDFLSSFFANNANFNCDGFTNSQDFFDFMGCFFRGCV